MENKYNRHSGHPQENTRRLAEARRALKAQKIKNTITALAIVVPLVIIAGWLLFDKLFIIRSFEIRGLYEYTPEKAEIAAESIGIHKGTHILGFNKKTAEAEAKYRLSEFDSVKIVFEMPDTVVLKVVEAEPSMYMVFGDKGYVLSKKLRVISACNDTSDCEGMGLIRLMLDNVTKCVAGEFLGCASGNDGIVKRLYAIFEEEGIASEITAIDVTDKFDISFEYKKQFEVKLGDEQNLTVKIRYMKAIIDELGPDDSGVIDVSDDEYRDATFKPYSKM
ncbi:MAG: FtsQ-type POTRA domain-containing protein [Oscillospiraceae bacterium]|nr:FtsQ-type POTRA domain-containing protein [Oscillospiraceae bacterium]